MQAVGYRILSAWPAYRVGSDGSIWSRWNRGEFGDWKLMRPTPDKDGYRIVRLYTGGTNGGPWKQARICRLVCEAFHGPCPCGQEVRHLDGCEGNDAQDNLAWGTSVENSADTLRHGTRNRGERHGNVKLTDAQIEEIRSLRGKMLQRTVAEKFGITQSYVSQLSSGVRRSFERLTQ